MEKTKKYYLKSMDYYCAGKIEKALDYCDKCLNQSKDYSPALNLKGMIYYIKGDLEQAQMTWRINYKLNGDEISKKYLEDSRKDEEVIKLFTSAVNDYNEIKIHKALEKFTQCEKSHFNILNLYNYLAKCYLKIGQYDKCSYYINEVLKIDKSNEIAIDAKKNLISMGLIKKEVSPKKIGVIVTISLILFFSLVIYLNVDVLKSVNILDKLPKLSVKANNKQNENKTTTDTNLANKDNNKSDISKNGELKENNKSEVDKSKTDKVLFNFNEVRENLEKKQYEKLIEYLEVYNKDDLTLNEKSLLLNVEQEVKNNGVKYFYEQGMEYIKNNNYQNAISSFNKIYKYSQNNYLNQHILYMTGFSYEKIYDVENANKFYEAYVDEYKNGDYIEPCLYNLALLNENIDKGKSKKYANQLIKEYPNSQYNNTKVNNIINN